MVVIEKAIGDVIDYGVMMVIVVCDVLHIIYIFLIYSFMFVCIRILANLIKSGVNLIIYIYFLFL